MHGEIVTSDGMLKVGVYCLLACSSNSSQATECLNFPRRQVDVCTFGSSLTLRALRKTQASSDCECMQGFLMFVSP